MATIGDQIARIVPQRHQPLIGRVFLVLLVLGIVADIILVEVVGVPSISERVWAAEKAHSILLAAVAMFGVLGGYFLRTTQWWEIAAWGVLIGHLITTP